jgi:nucleotide-binding universal stress UspA family protein
MKKVLIIIQHKPSVQKVEATGFSIAEKMRVGITLQYVVADQLFLKLLDIANFMDFNCQMKSSEEIQNKGIELKELSKQFLNKTKLNIGDASIHILLMKGDGNESVLEKAKEIEADVIFIIMANQNRKVLKNRVIRSVTERNLINSTVRVLSIATNKERLAIF